jgi:hypothetical protein
MQSQSERLENRFTTLFDQEGLQNVKFFAKDMDVSLEDFCGEAAAIQDTIAAGDFEAIESVDKDFPQRKFNEAF